MIRCRVCDYSPSGPTSYYHESLSLGSRPNSRLKRDFKEGGYVCSSCFDAIGDDIREMEDIDYTDFNRPLGASWEAE